ncbi:hypothetical protein [Pleomorphomonas koreensis]|uniref:hypothetical protein n=1 Tax=Pleomorphomonas koreensis TaxID=257440 RepID=UPI000411016E|nr:hypothetical protein [Pleomorphomonas koreensis]
MAEVERLKAPWIVAEHPESFVVEDASGQHLAYVYFEDEPGRRRATKRISKEMARRLANRIARIPDLDTNKEEGSNG